jgi:hypothetical protein
VRNYKNKKTKAAEISQNITSLFRRGRTPHPDWTSTKSFQSTGETFSLVGAKCGDKKEGEKGKKKGNLQIT